NRIDAVDPAMLRPGRFGLHIPLGLPAAPDREAILKVHLRDTALAGGSPLTPTLSPGAGEGASQVPQSLLTHLVEGTEGFSGADLAQLCQGAKLRALERSGFSPSATI